MKSIAALCATLLLMLLAACSASNTDTDTDDLTAMLHEFLTGVSEEAAHDRFWAEDLVYTSSRGTRTNKAEIMQGFGSEEGGESEESGPVYTAEEIRIQVYGTTAVVAFRLVATTDEATIENYFNTGTFVKRNGIWQVVAWQATKIPAT